MGGELNLCPDDALPLRAADDGRSFCPLCKGELCSAQHLQSRSLASLSIETRADSGAFAKTRMCPWCGEAMVPWRIEHFDAWLEKCQSCEVYWVEKLDHRVMQQQDKRAASQQVYAELSKADKEEYREHLLEYARESSMEPGLSPVHTFLALLGLPVVTRTDGAKTPWLTWLIAVGIFAAFFVVDADNASYVVGSSGLWAAFTSLFAHFGWLHLLGNLYFLVAFGDGVEQKLPRWALLALFVVGGIGATLAQGLVSETGAAIGGASGAVSVLIGACVMLQSRAKVAVGFYLYIFRMPLVGFGVFEIGFQAIMALVDLTDVAWTAHLAGLVLGLGVGAVVRWTR